MALAGLLQLLQEGGARASQIATQQEQPDQPSISHTVAAVGLSILTFVPQVNRFANSGPQEQPYHPPAVAQNLVAGFGVIGAIRVYNNRYSFVAQETVDEPQTWARIGVPPSVPPLIVPPITRNVYTRTEDSRLPPSWTTWPGPVPPVPITPVSPPPALTVQEWPDTPPSWAVGYPPPVAIVVVTLPGVNRYASNYEVEQPDRLEGYVNLCPGYTPYTVGPVTYFEVDQEVPDHPIGWAKIGVQPLPPTQFVPAGTHNVGTTQEQPDFSPGWARIGVAPFIVAWPASHAVLTRQEQPDEPPSWARIGGQPRPFSIIRHTVTVQEYPDLGYSRTWSGTPPVFAVTPVPPSTSYIVTRQEVPDHPLPATLGYPGPFGKGVAAPQVAVYNTLFLNSLDGMFSIPGNPPS